ncbi:MAG: CbiX/SirB N-terminal domain-containing protein [Dehalococcoidia bacterium]|nr:CbiX/SirB N-terminal domain-containing protein [Dehalococcoidia bacterium]
MKSVIVLAMHGAPPKNFPKAEFGEFMSLHARLESSPAGCDTALESRYDELEMKIRSWPRTADNDPFFASSQKIAAELERAGGKKVFLGFNEFCAPTLSVAIEAAVASGAEKVLIATAMMTRGGEHSEKDIRQAVEAARAAHLGVAFVYAWPFEESEVGAFLARHISRFENA